MPNTRIKVQHIARAADVDAIKRDGFQVRPRGQHFAHVFGPGVYFGFRGDKRSESFYACNGHDRTPKSSRVIEAVVKLDNPLVASGYYTHDVVKSMITALGGVKATTKAVNKARPELRDRYEGRNDFNGRMSTDWVQRRFDHGYVDYDAEAILDVVAREIGHDGLVIDQGNEFYSSVGGSQVVVFHPTKTNIRITDVRPVQEDRYW